MKETKAPKDKWKLDSLEIKFKQGYSYNNTKDRYEGSISFSNGERESFSFKVREDMANEYINLISKDIVKAAESLGSRLVDSLGLKNK